MGLLVFVREWVDFTWGFVILEWDFKVIRWDWGIFRELKVVGNKGLFEGASKQFSNDFWVFWVGIWVIEGSGREVEN